MLFKASALILAFKALAVFGAGDWSDCQKFIVDQCVSGSSDNPQVEVLHKVTIDDCDYFCNTVYADKCKFYIQDLRQDICELWTVEK